jgi:uncharacterized LabA/DUF88 family protein/cold shock CspA family protein
MTNQQVNVLFAYDGGYLRIARQYYRNEHDLGAWLNLNALHELICKRIANWLKIPNKQVRVTEAHLYAGRPDTEFMRSRGSLMEEVVEFDGSLYAAKIVTHYRRLRPPANGRAVAEKGVDVALSLATYRQVQTGMVDVVVLVAGDADFVPLLDVLQMQKIPVLVVAFDFCYLNDAGTEVRTGCSEDLKNLATWTIDLSEEINQRNRSSEIKALFPVVVPPSSNRKRLFGVITTLKTGYGFVRGNDGVDRFFFYGSLVAGTNFKDLVEGQQVSFVHGTTDRGPSALDVSLVEAQL